MENKRQRPPKNDFNVIEVNGMKFVAELEWVNLDSPLNYMREARDYGKKNNKSIVAIRKNRIIQAGFVPKESSAKKGMYSLAVAITTAIKEDFVGAFDLEDGSNRYVVVAALKGEIVALGDVIGNAVFAESTLQQILNLYSSSSEENVFKAFYAPKSFDFFEHELKLSDILNKKNINNEAKLRQLHFGLSGAELRSIALLFAVGFGGFYYWSGEQAKKRAIEQVRAEQRAAELERIKQASNQDDLEVEELDKPWVLQPSGKSTLKACDKLITAIPLAVGGWIFDSVRCQQSGDVEWRYRRSEYVSISDLQQSAHALNWPEPIVHFPGDGASFIQSFAVSAAGSDLIEEQNKYLNKFISYFQKTDIVPELSDVPHNIIFDAEGNQLPEPDWKHYRFVVTSEMSPASILANLPMTGVRIEAVAASLGAESSLTWRVEGSIYVNR